MTIYIQIMTCVDAVFSVPENETSYFYILMSGIRIQIVRIGMYTFWVSMHKL
jgi:hypothetical protein